jgi:WD40 repeat protein
VVLCSEKGLRHSVDITSDGKVAVTAGSERLVRVWDVELEEILASFATEGELDDCFIADDGKFVMAAESSGTVHVLRLDGTDNR